MDKPKLFIQNKKCVSEEEYFFYYWCLALKNMGYIDDIIYQPKPIPLSEQVNFTYKEKLKTKENIKTNELLKPHTYQPDFLIYWKYIAEDIFYQLEDNIDLKLSEITLIANRNKNGQPMSIIDTKGAFAGKFNNSAVTFPINQKWLYSKHHLYVNKVIPFNNRSAKNCFFTKTFTPDEYWYRPMAKQKGKFLKVNCIPKSLEDFLKERKKLFNKTLF